MSVNDQVRAVSAQFYAALDQMMAGDAGPMRAIWVHDETASAMHPIGGKTIGWDAVDDSFVQFAALASSGTVTLNDQRIQVCGDMAYETGTETGSFVLGGHPVAVEHRVTNIYRRVDRSWKVVHHHTDASPAVQEVLARLQP